MLKLFYIKIYTQSEFKSFSTQSVKHHIIPTVLESRLSILCACAVTESVEIYIFMCLTLSVRCSLISQDTCWNLTQIRDRTSTKYPTLPLNWLDGSVQSQMYM